MAKLKVMNEESAEVIGLAFSLPGDETWTYLMIDEDSNVKGSVSEDRVDIMVASFRDVADALEAAKRKAQH